LSDFLLSDVSIRPVSNCQVSIYPVSICLVSIYPHTGSIRFDDEAYSQPNAGTETRAYDSIKRKMIEQMRNYE